MKPIIKVENLGKEYRLGTVGTGTIKDDLKRWWYQLHGREDPFLQVGETNDRAHKGNSNYVWALRDINFEVMPGEVLGIIGRNGAGKSTLLKILSRVTEPTKGRVTMNGRVASLLEVGTGFHPDLTGRENIYLNGAILGMQRSEIDSKLDEIIDFAGIERYIDTPVKRYSSGMHVRLGFAVAAHLEPDILIVDEVLAVGDFEFQKKCLGKIKDVSSIEGRTVLFVSHDLNAISTLTRRALLINDGVLMKDGTTIDVVNYYLSDSALDNRIYLRQDHIEAIHLKKAWIKTTYENNLHKQGDQFEINLRIYAPTPKTDLCISVQVWDSLNVSMLNCWYYRVEGEIRVSPGYFDFKCIIPSLRLSMGSYSLAVFLADPPGGELYEFRKNICHFQIKMYDKAREYDWHPKEAKYIEEFTWSKSTAAKDE